MTENQITFRWWLGIALASLTAPMALGSVLYIQQAIAGGPSPEMDDIRGLAPFAIYVGVASVGAFLPVALVGFLTDSVLVRLRRHELWAYALAGLLGGAFIGWFLATYTPRSDEDPNAVTHAWRFALLGITASSTFWWVVRRKS